MIFSDLFFLYFFLALCIPIYFIRKNNAYRNAVLIVFSLIFYSWDIPAFILVLLLNVTVNWVLARKIDGYREGSPAKAKVFAAVAIISSLSLLVFFKYSAFLTEALNFVLPLNLPLPAIALPLGISFYTFKTVSYIMDCYWGRVKAQKSYLKFLMYVSLFPQMAAGPIVRYASMEREIDSRKTDILGVSEGVTRFAVGLAKKVIIADNLFSITDGFFSGDITGLSVLGTWYAVIVYAMWIYFDFSGYSDMAIGLGKIFGFNFSENFNYPFICRNITEFWQRWHITLGSFFRDYLLYAPIFGKRRPYGGLFLVWFCTGLWHGASWNFIIWGLYFGLFILIERKIGNKRMRKIPAVLAHIYNKTVIIVGFGIFYFTDMSKLGVFFKNLVGLGGNAFSDGITAASFVNNIFLVLAAVLFCMPVVPFIRKKLKAAGVPALAGGIAQTVFNAAIIAVCSIMLVNSTSNPFLYTNF